MDPNSLVEQPLPEQYINDGRRLLRELDRDGFDVSVALWARVGEQGKWRLHIASKEAETPGFAAHRRVRDALQRLPYARLSSEEIRVIRASDPFAKDALKARGQHTGPDPFVFTGWRLGDRMVHLAYIYPPPPYDLTPVDVVARMASLMMERQLRQRIEPSLVTLRDGSTRNAIPVGLQAEGDGPLMVKFVDVTNGQQMTLPAAEVVGID